MRESGWEHIIGGVGPFSSLVTVVPLSNGQTNRIAYDKFPEAVHGTKMNLWRPGDPIRTGKRLLVGVGLWNGLDLRMLDAVDAHLRTSEHNDVAVDVFDVCKVADRAEFELYIP